ncbi:MAG: DUF692 family protein, partial [Methylococcaceae bacterium]|nr:DUF692 family protein [Methylococcaceae bacterium]
SLSSRPDPLELVQTKGGADFVEYAGLIDVDAVMSDVKRLRDANIPLLYHPSYLNFCGTFPNHDIWLETTAKHVAAVDAPWFAQDCAYCFWQDSAGYSSQFGYFMPPVFNQASLDYAIERVREVQAAVPVPVAIEPPPLSFVTGKMPLFQFFGELAKQTDCALLLDMGHLVSYEMASGMEVMSALEHLPVEQVIEVHIAGGCLKETETTPVYVDAHECSILSQTWEMLEKMLPHLPNVKAVCYECEGVAAEEVLTTLKRLRQTVQEHSSSKALLSFMENK